MVSPKRAVRSSKSYTSGGPSSRNARSSSAGAKPQKANSSTEHSSKRSVIPFVIRHSSFVPFVIRHPSFFPMPDVPFAVAEPPARGHLQLREELHAFLALHVQVAEERIVPAVERKPRHRSRHADVDPDHAALDAVLEFARRLAVAGENRGAIAVGRLVDQLDGGVQ